jgi:hypothetical protein
MKTMLNSSKLLTFALGFSIVGAFSSRSLHAENWPQWRGPFFNGSTTETNLLDRWSKTENVAWVTPLPGKSGSKPVTWGRSLRITGRLSYFTVGLAGVPRRIPSLPDTRSDVCGDWPNTAGPEPGSPPPCPAGSLPPL